MIHYRVLLYFLFINNKLFDIIFFNFVNFIIDTLLILSIYMSGDISFYCTFFYCFSFIV